MHQRFLVNALTHAEAAIRPALIMLIGTLDWEGLTARELQQRPLICTCENGHFLFGGLILSVTLQVQDVFDPFK